MIASDVQKLEQDAIVEMYEIDASGYGGGLIRLAPAPVDGHSVMFGANEYLPFPIQSDGFEWSGKGTMPRPTMTVASLELSFLALVMSADDLVGSPVKRIRTYRKHLDDGADPGPLATFPIDYYVIERKSSQNRTHITFELSILMDQEGKKIPARQVIRDSCSQRYRWWNGAAYDYTGVTCPYVGTGEWLPNGEPSPVGADRCGKRLTDCKLRFGANGQLPFYGFPGVGRYK